MTRDEVKTILNEISALYPKFSNGFENRTLKVDLHYEILKEHSFDEIHKALIQFAVEDRKGFPPSVGQLIEKPEKLDWFYDDA